MSVNENQKLELFEDFYAWLKNDGLRPKRSERLHRKKIFASLLANDEMTLENFKDFQKDHIKAQILALKGESIKINGNPQLIVDIALNDALNAFVIKTEELNIRCKFENLKEIQNQIIYSKD